MVINGTGWSLSLFLLYSPSLSLWLTGFGGPLVSTVKQTGARFWLGTQLFHLWPGHCGLLLWPVAGLISRSARNTRDPERNKATPGTLSNPFAQRDPYKKKPLSPLQTSIPSFILFCNALLHCISALQYIWSDHKLNMCSLWFITPIIKHISQNLQKSDLIALKIKKKNYYGYGIMVPLVLTDTEVLRICSIQSNRESTALCDVW